MTKRDFILSVIASLLAAILFEVGRKAYPRLQKISIKAVSKNFFKGAKTGINSLRAAASFVTGILYDAYKDWLLKIVLPSLKKAALDGQKFLNKSASRILKSQLDIALRITSSVRQLKEVNQGRFYLRPAIGFVMLTGLICAALLVYLLVPPRTPQHERELSRGLEIASLNLAEERLLDISYNAIKQNLRTESFAESSQPTRPISLDNGTVVLKAMTVSRDKIVYRAESRALTYPIEVRIGNNSGSISLLKAQGSEEKTMFFVGVVQHVTEDHLTLIVSDEQGVETGITLPTDSAVYKPYRGQRVFVATDLSRVTSLKPL